MASGLRGASKRSSSRSLGSFVEVGSSSSEFEPVDLEEMESHSGEEGESQEHQVQQQQGIGVDKTATPPTAAVPVLRTVPEQSEIKSDTGGAGQYAEPLQEGLQTLENATQKAAEMAKDFTNKLFTSGASEARSSVMKLAGDVSSWWAALDPVPKQPQEPSPQATSRSTHGSSEVQDLFGLPEDEELMEKFPCQLVQTMDCLHNTFSKPTQVRFSGKLYVTDRHTCFNAEGIRFAIVHADIKKTERLQGSSKALRLSFGDEQYVCFHDFKSSDLDSALGLIEHVTESA